MDSSSENALISCIVPVFNGDRYLAETLNSILEQTYRPLEIIVIDDGSTDGTAGVAADYGQNIIYYWQENAGPAAARNRGIAEAKGEFITFLDADDLWHPEKLERQMRRFQDHPELELCITHVQNFWISELAQEEESFRNHPRSKPLPGYTSQTLLARRSLFDKIGLFNSELKHSDGTDLFIRAKELNITMELLPDVLVYRRIHFNNLSRQQGSESMEEYLKLIKKSLDRRRQDSDPSKP